MEIFVRYTDIADYPPMPYCVRAYDCRFFYILSGEGRIELDGIEYSFAPNTLCYYPAGCSYTITPETKLRFVSVNFDLTRDHTDLSSVMPPVRAEEYHWERCLDTQHRCGEELFASPFVLREVSFLRDILINAAEDYLADRTYSERRAAALIQYVCFLILDRGSEREKGLCDRIADYIRSNYSKRLTLANISEVFSYHPNYLGAIFRDGMGMTVHKYLMGIRLKKASELLVTTPLWVGEIATLVGFCNSDHFSACFSANIGISPTEFRNRGSVGIGCESPRNKLITH